MVASTFAWGNRALSSGAFTIRCVWTHYWEIFTTWSSANSQWLCTGGVPTWHIRRMVHMWQVEWWQNIFISNTFWVQLANTLILAGAHPECWWCWSHRDQVSCGPQATSQRRAAKWALQEVSRTSTLCLEWCHLPAWWLGLSGKDWTQWKGEGSAESRQIWPRIPLSVSCYRYISFLGVYWY